MPTGHVWAIMATERSKNDTNVHSPTRVWRLTGSDLPFRHNGCVEVAPCIRSEYREKASEAYRYLSSYPEKACIGVVNWRCGDGLIYTDCAAIHPWGPDQANVITVGLQAIATSDAHVFECKADFQWVVGIEGDLEHTNGYQRSP
jgi:hypothetical protein